jgi:glutaminyl-peptide cyclotransferase
MCNDLCRVTLVVLALLYLPCFAAECKLPRSKPSVLKYQVIATFPHDPNAFTQGLVYLDGMLYESTGQYGRSSLRAVQLQTGRVLQNRALSPNVFGEGLTAWKSNLIQLTWKAQTAFVYDRFSFQELRTFKYQGEGWGLTADRTELIMSDGSAYLRFIDPNSYKEVKRLLICDNGQPVSSLNELEYFNGQVYANVWHTDRIARISLHDGQVTGWLNLHALVVTTQPRDPEAVLNGIAYDPVGKHIFVTGKLWPKLYELTFTDK